MQRVHAVKFKNELIISVDRDSHKIQCPALCYGKRHNFGGRQQLRRVNARVHQNRARHVGVAVATRVIELQNVMMKLGVGVSYTLRARKSWSFQW